MQTRRSRPCRIAQIGAALLLLAPWVAAAEPPRSVVEELLDVLKARGQISQQEYQVLNERAREEEATRRRTLEQLKASEEQALEQLEAAKRSAAQQIEAAERRADERVQAAERRAVAARPVETRAVEPKASGTQAAEVAAPPTPLEPAATEPVEQVAKKEEAPPTFRASWKDGFRLESEDGAFQIRFGGRLQLDGALFGPSRNLQNELGFDSFESGVEFRRARLYAMGTIYEDFGWEFEYDFADQSFKNAFLSAENVPYVQQVMVGHFKEPLSLEELTSDNFTTFMERGLPNAFSPSRKTGAQIMTTWLDDRVTWAVGGFRGDTDDLGEGFGGEQAYDLTTRLTYLPWFEDGSHLLYAGLGYSHQFRSNFELDYASRPEAHLVPNLIETPAFLTDGVDLVDPAAALVLGPFSVQAEYIQTFVRTPGEQADPRFFGWYAFVSYFLTGESRGFKPEEAAFSRVRPRRNFGFGPEKGWGAFEVALRQSQLNLNSAGIEGGRLNDTTLGVTWYLNPNMRIMTNYVYADRTPASSGNVYECRFQVDY